MISDYSINKKHPDTIIYIDANGCHFNLTVNDFASEEEFQRWKQWSDENYHEQKKSDARYERHTIPESTLNEKMVQVPSAEDVVLHREELQECLSVIEDIRNRLTPTQFRRLVMYFLDGMTQQEIAEKEGVAQQTVSESLLESKNRASQKKYLRNI